MGRGLRFPYDSTFKQVSVENFFCDRTFSCDCDFFRVFTILFLQMTCNLLIRFDLLYLSSITI